MTQPTVIFPALFLGNKELYHSLASMPAFVLPVVEPRFLERTGYAGPCLVDDFSDLTRLLSKLDDWSHSTGRPITGIVGIDDEDQFAISQAIARHFAIPFHDVTTLSIASNKLLMKRQFAIHNVPTGRFDLIDTRESFSKVSVAFPNVLKTLTGSGSEYVFLNRSANELTENILYLQSALDGVHDDTRFGAILSPDQGSHFDTRRQYLVEEFLEGDEYSCDFLVDGDRIELIRLVKKLDGGDLGHFGGFYLMNERSAAESGVDLASLKAICTKVAGALGVSRGVQMLDFKLGPDGILRVIETSIRPGFSIFIALMARLYGYTSVSIAARLAAGEDVRHAIPDDEGLAVYLLADRAGTLARIDVSGLDALRTRIEIIDVWLYGKPGDEVEDSRHDHFDLIQGYVLVKNPGRQKIEAIAAEIRRACVIEMRPT